MSVREELLSRLKKRRDEKQSISSRTLIKIDLFSRNTKRSIKGLFKQRFKGEKHIPMVVKDGIRTAEFCGPFTHVEKRIRLGIQPLNPTDSVCKKHDLDYLSISRSGKDDETKGNLVRVADRRMIRLLKNRKGINASIARNAIKTKMLAENLGFIRRTKFVSSTY